MIKEITKHYVEYYLPAPLNSGKTFECYWHQIKERDPLTIKQSTSATGFRFFDIAEVILDDEEKLTGDSKNFSPMYYFGTRQIQGDVEIIKCDNGYIIIPNKEDITIEEYQHTLLQRNNHQTNSKKKLLSPK